MSSASPSRFRIKLTVAVYKDKKLVYRNDMMVPTLYDRRSEARAHIKKEIRDRLRNSNFFISPRVDFDLALYSRSDLQYIPALSYSRRKGARCGAHAECSGLLTKRAFRRYLRHDRK